MRSFGPRPPQEAARLTGLWNLNWRQGKASLSRSLRVWLRGVWLSWPDLRLSGQVKRGKVSRASSSESTLPVCFRLAGLHLECSSFCCFFWWLLLLFFVIAYMSQPLYSLIRHSRAGCVSSSLSMLRVTLPLLCSDVYRSLSHWQWTSQGLGCDLVFFRSSTSRAVDGISCGIRWMDCGSMFYHLLFVWPQTNNNVK